MLLSNISGFKRIPPLRPIKDRMNFLLRNLMPLIIEAAKSYATLGEIIDSMKVVFGEWKETAVV